MDRKIIIKATQLLLSVIVLCSVLPTFSFAQQNILDNQSILFETFITSMLDSELNPTEIPTVRLVLNPSNSNAEIQLRYLLTKAGYQLSTHADTTSPQLEINFDSENLIQKHRRNQYTRTISSSVTVFLIGSSHDIEQSVRFGIFNEERFESGDVKSLSSGWYPARFHEEKDSSIRSRFKRYGEPLLITSAIATSIYLLYNVRSQ